MLKFIIILIVFISIGEAKKYKGEIIISYFTRGCSIDTNYDGENVSFQVKIKNKTIDIILPRNEIVTMKDGDQYMIKLNESDTFIDFIWDKLQKHPITSALCVVISVLTLMCVIACTCLDDEDD